MSEIDTRQKIVTGIRDIVPSLLDETGEKAQFFEGVRQRLETAIPGFPSNPRILLVGSGAAMFSEVFGILETFPDAEQIVSVDPDEHSVMDAQVMRSMLSFALRMDGIDVGDPRIILTQDTIQNYVSTRRSAGNDPQLVYFGDPQIADDATRILAGDTNTDWENIIALTLAQAKVKGSVVVFTLPSEQQFSVKALNKLLQERIDTGEFEFLEQEEPFTQFQHTELHDDRRWILVRK